jgi:hypothetical protein
MAQAVAAHMMEIRVGDFHQFQAYHRLEFGLWPHRNISLRCKFWSAIGA